MSKKSITMQEFADRYPGQFRDWLEHLGPKARNHDDHEGWFVEELSLGETLFALSTQYTDYGGGFGADLYIFPGTFWASPKTDKWFASEVGGDDAAWAALIKKFF